jgi:hypothetical protein
MNDSLGANALHILILLYACRSTCTKFFASMENILRSLCYKEVQMELNVMISFIVFRELICFLGPNTKSFASGLSSVKWNYCSSHMKCGDGQENASL